MKLRLSLFLLLGAACQACSTSPSAPVERARALVLDGAALFDGTGSAVEPGARVVIEGERIACVGDEESCEAPEGAERVDLAGQWLLPGLVDAHVHFSQTGWFDGRPDTLDFTDELPYDQTQNRQKHDPERYYGSYLCTGITAVFDVGGFSWSWDLREPAEHDARAPHVAAAGPLVTHAPREQLNLPGEKLMIELTDPDAGRAAVRYLAAFHSDAVKVWFLSVSDEARARDIDARVRAVGDEASTRGLPLIVHATSLREAKVALEAGATLLVHGVDDTAIDDDFLSLAKANGTIYTPTLIVSDGYRRMFEAVKGATPVIDDPNHCIDAETRERILSSPAQQGHPNVQAFDRDLVAYRARLEESYQRKTANLRRVHEAGIPIAVGTDAGNPGTFHGPSYYVEIEAMQAAGIPAEELLVMATRNGARAMHREADFGTVEEGKIADLIVLASDPTEDVSNLRTLTQVVRAGKLWRPSEVAPRSE